MKKKMLFMSLALCASSAFAQTAPSSGIDPKNLDTSIRPGNDFYHYAAGGWLKSHPLDAEHTSNGAFTDLFELNQKRIQDIILQYASAQQTQGSLGQKIGSLYNLMMDSARMNCEGYAPIKPTLAKIGAIKNRKEYQLVMAQLDRNGEGTMMFGVGVGADQKNAEWNIVGVSQGVKLRDIEANYHKMTYAQLINDFPGIDWGNVFLASGFPAFDYVDVGQPEPIHEVEKILAEASLDDLKSYAEAKLIGGATEVL